MLSLRQTHLAICGATLAVILGAWGFEYFGYAPCELCLMQRYAYYTVIPLSLLLALQPPGIQRMGLYLVALIMLGSMIFGIYHAGVEWKFWAGPSTCTGGSLTGGLPDLTRKAVMCDQPAIRILGLSLAGWNAVVSAAVTIFALRAVQGSSSASQ